MTTFSDEVKELLTSYGFVVQRDSGDLRNAYFVHERFPGKAFSVQDAVGTALDLQAAGADLVVSEA